MNYSETSIGTVIVGGVAGERSAAGQRHEDATALHRGVVLMGRRTAGQFAGRSISEAVHFLLDDLLLRHTESASCPPVVRFEVVPRRHTPPWLLTQLGRDASIIDGGKVSMRGITAARTPTSGQRQIVAQQAKVPAQRAKFRHQRLIEFT